MIDRIFILEKETKNTVKFTEQPPTGQPPILGTIYIQKWAAGKAKEVKLTIHLGD